MAASHPASQAPNGHAQEASGFDIRLPSAQLADLIQINCLNRVRGVFRVTSAQNEGHLFFAEGKLAHAAAGGLTGLDAVVAMLGWRGGSIEPCVLAWPPQETIGMGTDALLLTASQRLDEQVRDQAGQASPEARLRDGRAGPGRASGEEATTRVVRRVPPAAGAVRPAPARAATTRAAAASSASAAASTPQTEPTTAPAPTLEADESGLSLRAAAPRESLSRLALARVSEDGHLRGPAGASSDLADTAFFCHQLGCRIGEGLGLGPLRALSAQTGGEGLVIFHARSIVAARGRGSDLLPILTTLGLE